MYLTTVMTAQIPDVKPTLFGLSSPRSPTKGYTCAFPSWPSRPCLDRRMPWEDSEDEGEEEESHECAGWRRRKNGGCAFPTTTTTTTTTAAPSSAERWDGRSISSTYASSTSFSSSTSTSTNATSEGKVDALTSGFEKLPLQPRSSRGPSSSSSSSSSSRTTMSLLSLAILGKAGHDV
ncbi:hypothetical protein L873DRAFT_1793639 [Choiromyces venosus 120613-1]|uniref:Uncharacterized protein n=1 Tax=Choiromyces venosus 120613-1 TaxID=1336337 RepID=A0A3N4J5I8_9PEZI|nr:hypothetical protein L873DRAFT_1793639 [Choiromyces venosus 120613-1]